MNQIIKTLFVMFYCFMTAINILLYSYLKHWIFIALAVISVATAIQFSLLQSKEEKETQQNLK